MKSKQKTVYVVLRSLGDYAPAAEDNILIDVPDVYAVVGEIEANSASEAVRHLAIEKKMEGTFRAVPARSFKDITVKVETEPRYVITGQTTLV